MPISQITDSIHNRVSPIARKLLSPDSISYLATKLPSKLNQKAVEIITNSVFKEQILDGDFLFLDNQYLEICIKDANLNIVLTFHNNKICCTHFDNHSVTADAKLSINTEDAIKLIKQEIDPDTLFFQRKLKISGNTELAHHVKNTVDTLDPETLPNLVIKLIELYDSKILQ